MGLFMLYVSITALNIRVCNVIEAPPQPLPGGGGAIRNTILLVVEELNSLPRGEGRGWGFSHNNYLTDGVDVIPVVIPGDVGGY